MDRSTALYLIKEIYEQDDDGVFKTKEMRRKVYGSVNSISRSEWFEGGRSGLNPALQFTLFFYDYNNEEVLEYDGDRYSIYRTYRTKDDNLELYTEKRKGTEDGKKKKDK